MVGKLDTRDKAAAVLAVCVPGVLMSTALFGLMPAGSDAVAVPVTFGGAALAVALARRRLRLFATAIGGGIVAGLALGVALRLAMRVAAMMGGGTELSVGGTLAVVVLSVIPGTVLSVVVAALRRVVEVPPLVLAPLVAAGGMLMILVGEITGPELSQRGALWANVPMFVASFALYGFVLVKAQRRIEAWWDRRTMPAPELGMAVVEA
jgi:hypothetical protein